MSGSVLRISIAGHSYPVIFQKLPLPGGEVLNLVTVDGEPIARLSVLVEGKPCASGCFWLKDWTENFGIVAVLESKGVFSFTGRRLETGRVTARECCLSERL